jgi:hypothetical protein
MTGHPAGFQDQHVGSSRPTETESSSLTTALERITGDVRRLLKPTENEPVGMLTAYRDSILRLADAIDRLAREIDSRTERH